MSKITKEILASIVIRYFTEHTKKYTYYKLSQITNFDQQSIRDWEQLKRKNIRNASFWELIKALQDELQTNFDDFTIFAISELECSDKNTERLQDIFDASTPFLSIIKTLLQDETPLERTLQEKSGTYKIIRILKSLLLQHREYFQVGEKSLCEMDDPIVNSIFINFTNIEKAEYDVISQESNYLLVKFPGDYNCLIILSNDYISFFENNRLNYFAYKIDRLKTRNNIDIMLIITDIDKKNIPFENQSFLMEKYNLFFEFIKRKDLESVSIQGLELAEEDLYDTLRAINQHRYAQLIYERLMSYLSVISVEIIFKPYLEMLHKELDVSNQDEIDNKLHELLVHYNGKSYTKRPSNKQNDIIYDYSRKRKNKKAENASKAIFINYANQILLKKICHYSYLTRHSIYYERNLVSDEVQKILKFKKIQKLPLVVEICASNSLTSCDIIDKCDKLLLFTASFNAYSLMKKLQDKTGGQFLPQNISIQLCHLNPEYMMHQYPDELNGNVDFLIIGYGAGSQITDLTRFIRYAYNWLSEDGVLFISVYNNDAIIFNRSQLRDQRFEIAPLYMSDYWIYAPNGQTPLLKTLKAYSPDSFHSTFFSLFDSNNISLSTYPYLSTLINPSDYSRDILDEIRTADKLFAKSGTHGQIISVFAHKSKSDMTIEHLKTIQHFLELEKISYKIFTHTIAPDSNSLKRSLQIINAPLDETTLLKTVILQRKGKRTKRGNEWIYVILPYDEFVIFDKTRHELVQESSVIKKYNQGTISPLTILAEGINNSDIVYLFFQDKIRSEYVLMSAGTNTKSIRLKTKDFFRLITEKNVLIQNILVD